ncbi:hypothetical protein ESA94_21190 [Lacibacter luteus]|uniref:Uncharacterized protein n=1 Tax=Lacibacter luteus TaxID=2508719 RepID=A0A4Q1CD13_9BACT|nr:hypothetical protein [Lacibacter luteus]RXK57380.1 hypothetical protein ESA94_21190 [Lacibacter luteus]
MNTKTVKGYFLWSIPFLFLACNSGPKPEAFLAPDPNNCEWYVKPDKEKDESLNKIGVYTLRFYPEGKYTLCADLLFEQGSWAFDNEKKLTVLKPVVTQDDIPKERYLIDQSDAGNKTQFSFYSSFPVDKANPDERINVEAVTNVSKDDPFAAAMHKWRAKPTSEETTAQLKERTKAYLQFLLALYRHAKDNDIENPGGTWYPQPIKFFGNKVRMAYADELADWNKCFYNEAQAVEGYKLISGGLMRVKITGENDVERNINCVEQLLTAIN